MVPPFPDRTYGRPEGISVRPAAKTGPTPCAFGAPREPALTTLRDRSESDGGGVLDPKSVVPEGTPKKGVARTCADDDVCPRVHGVSSQRYSPPAPNRRAASGERRCGSAQSWCETGRAEPGVLRVWGILPEVEPGVVARSPSSLPFFVPELNRPETKNGRAKGVNFHFPEGGNFRPRDPATLRLPVPRWLLPPVLDRPLARPSFSAPTSAGAPIVASRLRACQELRWKSGSIGRDTPKRERASGSIFHFPGGGNFRLSLSGSPRGHRPRAGYFLQYSIIR